MSKIKPIDHAKLEKFAEYVGCVFKRQESSHKVYWRSDQIRPVIIPQYKEVPIFIIQNILRQLKISRDEFLRILEKL